MWFALLMPIRTVATLAGSFDGTFSWASPPYSIASESDYDSDGAGGSARRDRNQSRKQHLQAEKRRQKWEKSKEPPATQAEWLTRCKGKIANNEASKNPAGSSIFQLDSTSLTTDVMTLLKEVLRDDYCHLQGV